MIRSRLDLQAQPGRRTDLLARLDRLEVISAVQDRQGFLGIAVLVDLDDPERVVVESSWSSREHLERWVDGPGIAELIGKVRDVLAAEPETRVFQLVDTIS